ncbi:hypothetical protein [Streptomyces morookaense]|uniref:Bulb-type lectin domain-containing protein n=1 Tax=Streptomyces morookaense TaxID=1970 RepID=A0A7Y7B6F5_STRMO|nr:hypothetical protein [Streptomyces morookaense]NVK79918.1 hypothetical protein [Streptomyces morookaense]GHF51161.1 hypothetical protein GCM10010359_61900 [Streptomyces morookaense]
MHAKHVIHTLRATAVATAAAGSLLMPATALAAAPAPAPSPSPSSSPGHNGYVSAARSDAQIRSFWEKHAHDKTFAPTLDKKAEGRPGPERRAAGAEDGTAATGGESVKIAGTRPATPATAAQGRNALRSGPADLRESVRTFTGRLNWDLGGGYMGLCTATVVVSDNHDTLATARHCMKTLPDKTTIDPNANYRFAPGWYVDASGEHAPYGWFTWRGAAITPENDQQNDDTAFIAVNPQNGKHVQDVVGSAGIAFNAALPSNVAFAGIPGDVNQLHVCEQPAHWGQENPPQILLRSSCDGDSELAGGASGGGVYDADAFRNGGGVYDIGSYSGSYLNQAAAASFRDEAVTIYRAVGGSQGNGDVVLKPGFTMKAGSSVAAGGTTLTLQKNGQLHLNGPRRDWWSGQPDIDGAHLDFQSDGNLVMYDGNGTAHWALNLNNREGGATPVAGSTVKVQADGNLVVYGPDGAVKWAAFCYGTNRC